MSEGQHNPHEDKQRYPAAPKPPRRHGDGTVVGDAASKSEPGPQHEQVTNKPSDRQAEVEVVAARTGDHKI